MSHIAKHIHNFTKN